jgi:AraC family transcriptional regulator of adaptative response/methylated-DNA-[protein]-cysteine methyltransferase
MIPCHRIIIEDGNLADCGGGLFRKKWLPDLEKSN